MKYAKITIISLGAFSLLSITGCLNLNGGDGTDEQSVTAQIGALAFASVGGANGVSTSLSASGAPPLSSDGASIPAADSTSPIPLAKTGSLGSQPTDIDSSEMASKGIVTVTLTGTIGQVTTTGTLVIQCQTNAQECVTNPVNFVSVEERIENAALNTIRIISVTDLDGDGIVNGESQYRRAARARLSNQYNFLGATYLDETVLDFTSGPDGDFGDENGDPAQAAASRDNQIIALSWTRIKNGLLTNSANYSDADNDGIIIDPTSVQTSLIHLDLFETGNVFKPFVESSDLYLTIEVTPGSEDGRIVSLSGEENLINGRVNKLVVENAGGSDIIVPNADVNVALTTKLPVDEDSLIRSEFRLLLNVGSGLEDSTDNLLKEIHAVHETRIGPVASASFDFVANPPVPHGEEPQGGTVDMLVEFRNGDSFSVSGEFSPTGLQLTITGPEGNSFTGEWDAEGNLISEPNS